MHVIQKARAPEPKTGANQEPIRWRASIATRTEPQTEPTYWTLEGHGATPLIGIGGEPEAANYLRLVNHGCALNSMTVRPISQAEAETPQATILAAALHGDHPPIFTIANEMPCVHPANASRAVRRASPRNRGRLCRRNGRRPGRTRYSRGAACADGTASQRLGQHGAAETARSVVCGALQVS
jgi:hypothetical protein